MRTSGGQIQAVEGPYFLINFKLSALGPIAGPGARSQNMTNEQWIFLAGIIFFGVLFVVTLVVGAIYYARGARLVAEQYNRKNGYHVHWTNTHWIYGTILLNALFFLWLYATQFQGQGIAVSISGQYLLWARWWVLALNALVNAITLTYVMTYRSRDIQSLVLVLLAPLAYVTLFCATVSQDTGTRGTALFFACFFYLLSMLAYLVPLNKWRVTGSRFHSDIDGKPWGAYYHRAFYVLLIVTFVFYVLFWILDLSNELTSAISFEGTCIAYLVIDTVSLGLFALYMYVLTGTQNLHNLQVEKGGQVAYKNQVPLGRKK